MTGNEWWMRARAAAQEGWRRHGRWLQWLLAAGIFVTCFVLGLLFAPPGKFPAHQYIQVPAGASSVAIGSALKEQRLVVSSFLFQAYTRLTGEDRALEPGAYVFDRPLGLVALAWRMSHGEHGIVAARVTLTEGMTTRDMASALAAQVPGFDAPGFLRLASTSEGYLFPDTYFIYPGTTAAAVYQELTERFKAQVATIQPSIDAFGKPLREDVIMASILEREAKTPEDMRIVSGILWKRLSLGMPLQVDAAFGYAHGENGYTPTAKDLSADSPYNTYLNKGLPPTPISNPGLAALQAAVTPEKTAYLYYLTGTDGKMHYAATLEQHAANRTKYLK